MKRAQHDEEDVFQKAEESLREKRKKIPAGIILCTAGILLIAGALILCWKTGLFG